MDFLGDYNKIYDDQVYRMVDMVRYLRLSRPTIEKLLLAGKIPGAKKVMYSDIGKNGHWTVIGSDLKRFIREHMSSREFICL